MDGGACQACGAPADPRQDYCLECGARIVRARGPFAALRRGWERRLGRYPGDWIWVSLLALGVAAGGAAAAIAATKGDGSGGSETIVATSPVVTAPPPPAPKPRPKPATTSTTPTPPPKPKTLTRWPAKNGYAVVLSSIPARGTGLAEAKAKAKAALDAGLSPAGILVSSNFSSLHPGYYVVFAGIYDSLEEAQAAVPDASQKFPNAYARQIAR